MISNSDLTIQTYRENFEKYASKTALAPIGPFKEWIDRFAALLPRGATVFEIGSATGRDARYLAAKGFKVTCTDVVPGVLDRLSVEGFETAEFDFRNYPKAEWIGNFDGVFANAALLHAPQDVFENALKNVTRMLKPRGVFAFSLKAGEGEEVTSEKMDAPRYFNYHSEPEIRGILTALSLEILSVTDAEEGKWLHVIGQV